MYRKSDKFPLVLTGGTVGLWLLLHKTFDIFFEDWIVAPRRAALVGPLQTMISQGKKTAPARGKLEPHLGCAG
jgi:hypothetical protein